MESDLETRMVPPYYFRKEYLESKSLENTHVISDPLLETYSLKSYFLRKTKNMMVGIILIGGSMFPLPLDREEKKD